MEVHSFRQLTLTRGGKIAKGLWNALMSLLQRTRITSVVGGKLKESTGGITLVIDQPGVITPTFNVEISGIVEPGTFNSVYPTISGTSIETVPAPTLSIATSGGQYVYLKPKWNWSTTASDFAYDFVYVDSIIEVESSEDADPLGPRTGGTRFKILLASFTDGAKTGQPVRASLAGTPCPSGASDGKAMLTPEAAG